MRATVKVLRRLHAFEGIFYTASRQFQQSLDILTPQASGPCKQQDLTCIYIHGGSWQSGDKSSSPNREFCESLAASGYLTVSLNYRLSPHVRHPSHAKDVAKGIMWVKENISRYGGNPNRIVLIGHSAGAHLALHVAADRSLIDSSGIRSLIGISGVYNIPRMASASVFGSLVISPAFGDRVGDWREASILSMLAKHASTSPMLKIPLLLLNAEEDFHLSIDSKEIIAWARIYGTSAKHVIVAGTTHFSILKCEGGKGVKPSDTIQEISSFIAIQNH